MIVPLKLEDVIVYLPESPVLSVIVTKSPDEVMVILLGGVIVYPLGAAGTRPGIVCGFNLLTASGTE